MKETQSIQHLVQSNNEQGAQSIGQRPIHSRLPPIRQPVHLTNFSEETGETIRVSRFAPIGQPAHLTNFSEETGETFRVGRYQPTADTFFAQKKANAILLHLLLRR